MNKLFNNFKYDIGYIIKDEKRELEVINFEHRIEMSNEIDRKDRNYKYYNVKCLKCGWSENWITEKQMIKYQCSCCTGRVSVKGINTVGDIHPHLLRFFKHEDDAYKYTPHSKKVVQLKCPNCGSEKQMIVASLTSYNMFVCDICNEKTTFPERIMASILFDLNIPFEKQYSPNWANKKKYDFYVPLFNMIIETHGGQHYSDFKFVTKNKSLEDTIKNDKFKLKNAIENCISEYVIIDCRMSDFNFIINNIKNSKLKEYIDFGNLNIRNVIEISLKPISEIIWEMTKTHTHYQIANELKMHRWNVSKYIKLGNSIGKCNYNTNRGRRVGKYTLDGELTQIFNSVTDAIETLNDSNANINGIINCCESNKDIYYNFKWKYLPNLSFDESLYLTY